MMPDLSGVQPHHVFPAATGPAGIQQRASQTVRGRHQFSLLPFSGQVPGKTCSALSLWGSELQRDHELSHNHDD